MVEQKAPGSEVLGAALNVFEGKALYDGKEYTLQNRVAWQNKEIWYDLTNEKWQAIRITPDGWLIVNEPPILFRRYSHQLPQVIPQREGNVDLIWDFVNIKGEQHKILYLVRLISCFIPGIPHPVLVPYGEQGAAKTTLCKIDKLIVDPSQLEVLQLPSNKDEFIQQLDHHWVAPYDNVSSLSLEYSDIICRAVTGQGASKRGLYSDDDDFIYNFKRVVVLNGINIAVTQPDLMDRSILLELQPIPDSQRKEDKQVREAFNKARPSILGGILDTLCSSLKIYDAIKQQRYPRMADFTHWGCAIAKALGRDPGDFVRAYENNMKAQNDEVLSGNPIGNSLCFFMNEKDRWKGTASELLEELAKHAEELHINTRDKSWPKAANALSHKLNILKPNLRKVGIEINRDTTAARRLLTLSKVQNHDDDDDSKKIPSLENTNKSKQSDDDDDDDDTFSLLGEDYIDIPLEE